MIRALAYGALLALAACGRPDPVLRALESDPCLTPRMALALEQGLVPPGSADNKEATATAAIASLIAATESTKDRGGELDRRLLHSAEIGLAFLAGDSQSDRISEYAFALSGFRAAYEIATRTRERRDLRNVAFFLNCFESVEQTTDFSALPEEEQAAFARLREMNDQYFAEAVARRNNGEG